MLQVNHTQARKREAKPTAIRRELCKLEKLTTELARQIANEAKCNDLLHRSIAVAYRIIGMPATSNTDLLCKVIAVGVLIDRTDDTAPLSEWEFIPGGGPCDEGPTKALRVLRDDLHRLHGGL